MAKRVNGTRKRIGACLRSTPSKLRAIMVDSPRRQRLTQHRALSYRSACAGHACTNSAHWT